MILALVAVPHVVLVQHLRLLEFIEAVVYGDCFALVFFFWGVLDFWKFTTRKMRNERWLLFGLESFVPDDVEDEVLGASVSIIADVVFDSNLVKHVEDSKSFSKW